MLSLYLDLKGLRIELRPAIFSVEDFRFDENENENENRNNLSRSESRITDPVTIA
jgi:hypothetical protein